MTTQEFQQERRKAHHGDTTIPDFRAVIPTPFPFLLGVQLHFRGQLSSGIKAHLWTFQTCGDEVGQTLNKRFVGIEGTNPTEIHHPCFRCQLAIFDIDFFQRFDVLADETDRHNNEILGFGMTQLF